MKRSGCEEALIQSNNSKTVKSSDSFAISFPITNHQDSEITGATLAKINPPTKIPLKAPKEKFHVQPEYLNVGNFVFVLDAIGLSSAPALLEESSFCYSLVEHNCEFADVLKGMLDSPSLKTLTVCGGIESILALATGLPVQIEAPFNSTFITNLATQRNLDIDILQKLLEAETSEAFLLTVNRFRLGWLFDEVCKAACFEVGKQLKRGMQLEVSLFGSSGALLGRAFL